MKTHERGVLPDSNLYFHIPKEQDRKRFLTLGSSGYFFCDDTYRVARNNYGVKDIYQNNYGSYLCLYVKNGHIYVYQNDRKIILSQGDAFLLDCHHPHSYGTPAGSGLEMVWVHFDGAMVRNYFTETVKSSNCSVLRALPTGRSRIIFNNLYTIYEQLHRKKGINNILINKYLVVVLTEFLLGDSAVSMTGEEGLNDPWDDLLSYISENIQSPLNLELLAERMDMSPSHFIRQFKKNIGYTPHRYVLMARIGTAIYLLKENILPLKEVAYTCGFSSEGSFCNAFKNVIGMWPLSYRDKTR